MNQKYKTLRGFLFMSFLLCTLSFLGSDSLNSFAHFSWEPSLSKSFKSSFLQFQRYGKNIGTIITKKQSCIWDFLKGQKTSWAHHHLSFWGSELLFHGAVCDRFLLSHERSGFAYKAPSLQPYQLTLQARHIQCRQCLRKKNKKEGKAGRESVEEKENRLSVLNSFT